MSSTGTTTDRSNVFCDRRLHDGHRAPAGEEGRDLVDRPDRGRQPDALGRRRRAGRRAARGSARGARRAWSRTRRAPRRRSRCRRRAAPRAPRSVSSRNSDSGVVMRMSDGRRANTRRSSAGVSPERIATVTSGVGQPQPRRSLADAGQRRAQVALDVDGQRLERADVEHPAAAQRVVGGGQRGEPVERGQERGERLARSGRRDDQGVLAARDRLPRADLGRRGRDERAVQPGLGGGGEQRHERQSAPTVRQLSSALGGSAHVDVPLVELVHGSQPDRPGLARERQVAAASRWAALRHRDAWTRQATLPPTQTSPMITVRPGRPRPSGIVTTSSARQADAPQRRRGSATRAAASPIRGAHCPRNQDRSRARMSPSWAMPRATGGIRPRRSRGPGSAGRCCPTDRGSRHRCRTAVPRASR